MCLRSNRYVGYRQRSRVLGTVDPREDRKLRKIALTLAAFGLAAAPLAAQSDTDTMEEGSGVSAAPIIGFALAAIAIGIFAGGDDDEPVSA